MQTCSLRSFRFPHSCRRFLLGSVSALLLPLFSPVASAVRPNTAPVVDANQILSGGSGVAFSNQQLQASDADSDPLTYSLVNSTLPSGLQLTGDGRITGTTSAFGRYTLQVKVNDGFEDSATVSFALNVAEPPSLVVNSTNDPYDPYDGVTTLRDAIELATTDRLDTPITFDATVFATAKTIQLMPGNLEIHTSIDIIGPASGVTISGEAHTAIFAVTGGSSNFRNLILANGAGNVLVNGGAINLQGAVLTLTNCTLRDNVAPNYGGAIANSGGTLTLTNCTLAGNSVLDSGSAGGAIYQDSGSLTLLNCTVALNSAPNGTAAALFIAGGTATMGNTIVAANLAPPSSASPQIDGSIESLGYNLIGDDTGANIFGTTTGNQIGVAAGLDPDGLLDNGGPVTTIALTPSSLAVDAGQALGSVTTDARALARPFDNAAVANASGGDGSDIGAFEAQAAAPEIGVLLIPATGPASDLADGLASIDYGTQEVSSTTDAVFSIKNRGGLPLTLSGTPKVAVSGTDASQFAVLVQPTAATLATGESTLITVRFNPTSIGTKNALLSIASNDADEASFDINLTASAQETATVAPIITAPRNGGDVYLAAKVNFTLPEAALSGTVKILIYSFETGDEIETVLDSTFATAGPHTAAIDLPTASFPPGEHCRITVSYQDLAGHAVAAAVSNNVLLHSTRVTSSILLAPDDDAPGQGTNGLFGNAVIAKPGVPAIDADGTLAFRSTWVTSGGNAGSGLFASDNRCLGVVGGSFPGITGATYGSFKDPVISKGHVLSIAKIKGTPKGDVFMLLRYAAGANTPSIIATTGTVAPVAGGTPISGGAVFASFSGAAIEDKAVAFLAKLSGGTGASLVSEANDLGLWLVDNSHSLTMVLREGQLIGSRRIKTLSAFTVGAGSPGQGRGWLTLSSTSTPQVLALVKYTGTDGAAAIVSADFSGTVTVLAQTAVTGEGGPAIANATFASLGLPIANRALHSAMLAKLTVASGVATTAKAQGIFLDSGTATFAPIARLGSVAGATKAKFSLLKDPVLAEDDGLAFASTLASKTLTALTAQTLWWKPPGGALTLVAQGGKRPGVDLPAAMQWQSFSSLAIVPGRGPIFAGKLVVGKGGVTVDKSAGVWACDFGGTVKLLFRTGDKIDGKTLKSFKLLNALAGSKGVTRSFNAEHHVVWQATFTNGTTALVMTEVP